MLDVYYIILIVRYQVKSKKIYLICIASKKEGRMGNMFLVAHATKLHPFEFLSALHPDLAFSPEQSRRGRRRMSTV